MKFGYYKRLTTTQKATYRKSDEVTAVPIPDIAPLARLAGELEAALASGKRLATAKAAGAFALTLCRQLRVPPVRTTVRLVRPAIRGGELHGLYTFGEGRRAPRIEVWMKTASQHRVVRFRTFVRTLVHELMHHVDVALLGLDDSFHTQGFYRRESSVMRQILPPPRSAKPRPPKKKATPRRGSVQLALFEDQEMLSTSR